jgi:hypothetical protein
MRSYNRERQSADPQHICWVDPGTAVTMLREFGFLDDRSGPAREYARAMAKIVCSRQVRFVRGCDEIDGEDWLVPSASHDGALYITRLRDTWHCSCGAAPGDACPHVGAILLLSEAGAT